MVQEFFSFLEVTGSVWFTHGVLDCEDNLSKFYHRGEQENGLLVFLERQASNLVVFERDASIYLESREQTNPSRPIAAFLGY